MNGGTEMDVRGKLIEILKKTLAKWHLLCYNTCRLLLKYQFGNG